ncbi:tetratricopeptide repeat protein [Erythrobacter sp. R86502]|uniref:tetratricopeptide repeat protein n=1 Tax=Erythrobacter sp. R86502 TaxID=3093846 RepID=UPI0036D3AF8A
MTTSQSQLAQIHAQMQGGDVPGALRAIAAVVSAEPRNGAAWQLAGMIRRRSKDFVGAVAGFNHALTCGVRTAELHNSLALTYEDLEQFPEAESAYQAALACDPGYLQAQINAARLKHKRGHSTEAVAALRSILERHPTSVLASNALAGVLADEGDAGLAADQYRASLARSPDNLAATIRLGVTLREDGQADAALAHLQAAAARFGQSPEFVDAMCGALIECGKVAEAETLLERLVQQTPSYFPAHRALARLAYEYRTGKDPYRSYRAMLNQWPAERTIWQNWFGLMLDHRDHAEVVTEAEHARKVLGALPEIDFYEAVARGELGQGEEAEQLYARAHRQFGETAGFIAARARNALRRGEPLQTQALARQAAERDRSDQFAWAYLGLAWRLLDDPREFWLHDYTAHVEQRPVPYLSEPGALDELRDTLRSLHRASHHPPDQSLRGGTQTEGELFKRSDPVIRRLRDAIREQVDGYITRFAADPAHPHYWGPDAAFRFSGSWSVRLTGQGFHVAHIHRAGSISSALHITVPPANPDDVAEAGALVLGAPPSELGLDLAPRRVVPPIEGALVLFPSSMWHGTHPFTAMGERLTVAFDVSVIR